MRTGRNALPTIPTDLSHCSCTPRMMHMHARTMHVVRRTKPHTHTQTHQHTRFGMVFAGSARPRFGNGNGGGESFVSERDNTNRRWRRRRRHCGTVRGYVSKVHVSVRVMRIIESTLAARARGRAGDLLAFRFRSSARGRRSLAAINQPMGMVTWPHVCARGFN